MPHGCWWGRRTGVRDRVWPVSRHLHPAPWNRASAPSAPGHVLCTSPPRSCRMPPAVGDKYIVPLVRLTSALHDDAYLFSFTSCLLITHFQLWVRFLLEFNYSSGWRWQINLLINSVTPFKFSELGTTYYFIFCGGGPVFYVRYSKGWDRGTL